MQQTIRKGALLAGVFAAALLAATPSSAARLMAHHRAHQDKKAQKPKKTHHFALTQADIGVTYSGESSKLATQAGNHFWLNGGSVDGALTLYRGLGFAANLNVDHAAKIAQSTGLGKTSFVFGPRYTKETSRWIRVKGVSHSQVYGEALFGVAHGFDSLFPTSSGSSAGSPAIQVGTGMDLTVWKGFAIRPFELDYIHTAFPNGAANSQHDFRLSFGVSYRFNITQEQRKAMERHIAAAKNSVHPHKAVARVRHPRQSAPAGTAVAAK